MKNAGRVQSHTRRACGEECGGFLWWIFGAILTCNLQGFGPEQIRRKIRRKIRRMIYSDRRDPPQIRRKSAAEIRHENPPAIRKNPPRKIRHANPPHNDNPLCKLLPWTAILSKCRSDKHAGRHLDDSLSPCWLMVEPKWQRQTFIQQHV